MKKLRIAVMLTFVLTPLASYAQERATIDVGYVGGDLTRTIHFPTAPGGNLGHGNDYVANGFDVRAAVKTTEIVTVTGRYQRKMLGNAQNFTDMLNGSFRGRRSEPDTSANGQQMDYMEVAGRFELPKTHGHALLVGLARTTTDRRWQWKDDFGGIYTSEDRDVYTGLVYGVAGTQKAKALTFDYAARSYYHLMLRENGAPNKLPASGYELGGGVMWSVADHLGVGGGYEFRRRHIEVGTTPYNSTEDNDDHGPVVRVRLSF